MSKIVRCDTRLSAGSTRLRLIIGFAACWLSLLSARSWGDVPPDVLAKGKRATALIELPGGQGFGSAFCISTAGLFVTNAHVAEVEGADKRLTRKRATFLLFGGKRSDRLPPHPVLP